MNKFIKRFLLIAAMAIPVCTIVQAQEEPTYLNGIQSLDFIQKVSECGPFTFDCRATFDNESSGSIGSVINLINETLVSDGKGYVQITSYTYENPSRLTFSVNYVQSGAIYRVVKLITEDGEVHSIIQGTIELRPQANSNSRIFPNPAFGKTFTVSGCAPELEWYMTCDNVIIQDSVQEGTGESLVFGPFWQKGDYSIYNEYLGYSTYSSYIAWYGIFEENGIESLNNIPEEINIPYGGGVVEYDIHAEERLSQAEYSYIAEQMNTIGIPECWDPGIGMEVEMNVVPGAGLESTLHLTFRCEPNFSSKKKRQNTMFCLASEGRTVKLVQSGNLNGRLEVFTLTGEWISGDEFSLVLSGSQPGVIYKLLCNDTVVRTVKGDGEPVDWGTMSVQGTYEVLASFEDRTQRMDGVLHMVRNDYVYGDNYVVIKTMLSDNGDDTVSDVTYFGGLGYPVQIQKEYESGSGSALSTPIVYDILRRPDAQSYLSYPSSGNTLEYSPDAVEEDVDYYTEKYEDGGLPYKERKFETYKNGRVLSVRKPGLIYEQSGKQIKFSYRLNTDSDSIRNLNYTYAISGLCDSVKCSGIYQQGTLECTMTVNEDNDTSYVFVNPFGRKILSRRINNGERYDTYFVYDLKDSLVCSIQPGGIPHMPDKFGLKDDFAGKWCFTYKYDAFGNVIERHTPGAGYEEIFYDIRNRPVLYTDGELERWGKFRYVMYDGMDRVTSEGYCSLASPAVPLREWLMQGGDIRNIVTSVRPVREVVYYQDGLGGQDSGFEPDVSTGNSATLDTLHCMTLPMMETLYPEPDVTAGDFSVAPFEIKQKWFYDSFGRPVQIAKIENSGAKFYESYKYDFTGNVLVSSQKYFRQDGVADSLVLRYTYDQRGRVLSYSRIMNGVDFPEVKNSYDDLGRLGVVSAPGRVASAYSYNLQGSSDMLSTAAYGYPVFTQKLSYYEPVLESSVPCYTGRISEIEEAGQCQDSGYMSYYYDHTGRLSDSHRSNAEGERTWKHEERAVSYDADGNITTLIRSHANVNEIDSLSFHYDGNMLMAAGDGGSSWEYAYDSRGNVSRDGRSGLDVSYNFLNLPAKIRIRDSTALVYTYLSDGTMVAVRDSVSGNGFMYRGPFVYRTASDGTETLESVTVPDGRLLVLPDGNFADAWFVRDYLGSVRVVINICDPVVADLSGTVMSCSAYFPFGTRFTPGVASAICPSGSLSADVSTAVGRWRFNGKPEQVTGLCDIGLLDYGARFYDPCVARWTTIDPMAYNYPGMSPYAFCGNDPVNNIDPDGDIPFLVNLIGGVASAVVEYAGQVVANVAKNGEISTSAFTNVDVLDIAVFFAEGFVTSGGNIVKKAAAKAAVAVVSEVARNAVDVEVGTKDGVKTTVNSVAETTVNTTVGLAAGSVKTDINVKPFQTPTPIVNAERAKAHSIGKGLPAEEAKSIANKTKEDNQVKKSLNKVVTQNVNSAVKNMGGTVVNKVLFNEE